MADESFDDKEVANILNRDFVSVKVDREERPDIDAVYMNVCQAITGRGGWPLTIIMTPDQKPFYAGTYLPKHSKYGMHGLIELLQLVRERWETDRKALIMSGDKIIETLDQDRYQGADDGGIIDVELMDEAVEVFERIFDSEYGGFGGAPKFPTPHNLIFLLRYSVSRDDPHALEMVEKTLEGMYRGGIFDHVGYGFSRYSTDDKWLVPHFEKMLYDNALLTITYLEAYQVTGCEFYKQIAEMVLIYISREMTSPEGAFPCTQLIWVVPGRFEYPTAHNLHYQ